MLKLKNSFSNRKIGISIIYALCSMLLLSACGGSNDNSAPAASNCGNCVSAGPSSIARPRPPMRTGMSVGVGMGIRR
ncbi:MAG: hypothetical protein FWC51_00455 [Proteobacteria bacterium]|nr:hypothetical protein [Pseudomonadota bacterium]